ncbi:MAG TPA: efflux RND transporter periplasmic adaptor subunit [Chloroflexota bacterium]|nr:efflux RND transporter periplasmic adaptor subunit [Chloroflexota bacterium]
MRALKPTQYVMLLVALVATTGAGYLAYQRFGPKPAVAAVVTTVPVTRGSVAATVNATGAVASPAQTRLTFKSGGRVTEMLVQVGDQVQAGQPLARIDPADLKAALDNAQANYNSAVAKLETARAGSRPEDIAAAQAQVQSAQLALAQKRAVPGSPDMAAAQSQLASAQIALQKVQNPLAADVAAAQAQLDAANAKLQATLNPRAEDIATAQSQVNTARAKLEQLQNPRAEDVQSAQAAVTSAQAKLNAVLHPRVEDITQAQVALDTAKTKLAQLQDQPQTATPQDLANAELAINNAQVAYERALADAAASTTPNVGSAAAPNGTSAAAQANASKVSTDASVTQALIGLQQAQNDLQKLKEQGPSAWDVRTAQQAVEQAQASLDKAKNPSADDVAGAQAALQQAQATLTKTQNPDLYDVQSARESVAQAESNLQKLTTPSGADVAGAQQAVVAAQTALDKLTTPSDYDVQSAQEGVRQAQAGIDKLLQTNGFDVQTAQASLASAQANLQKLLAGSTDQDIATAQAAVDQAAASLRQAQANLNDATLTAPIAGVVVATGANPGENTSSGTASTTSTSASSSTDAGAVTLVDPRQLRVDLVVDEADIAKVQPGQDANLTFDALPGKTLAGKVSVISPTATTTNGVVTYQVRVAVDPDQAQAAGVRSGMTATGSIVIARKDDAVLVPNRSLRTQGQARTVQVLDANGQPATRPVQVGIAGDQATEIVSGLQPGDRVVTTPATTTRAATGAAAPGGGFAGRAPAPARP